VKDSVVFAEGDNHDLIINENFIRSVETIIKKDYYKYDQTYLTCMEINPELVDPMIIVTKESVMAAWTWYEHYLNVAVNIGGGAS
jgi:hypothetical protein